MEPYLKTLSAIADVMTILGLGGLFTWGILRRDTSLFGRKLFNAILISSRLVLAVISLLVAVGLSHLPLMFFVLLLRNSANNLYWENGKEIEHILAYLLTAPFFFPLAAIPILAIATSSLYYPKKYWNFFFARIHNFDLTTYAKFRSLEIVEAVYRTHQRGIDVTHILRSLVDSGQLRVKVSNHLAGDPHFGVPKFLEVKYVIDGTETTARAKEDEILSIP